MTQQDTNETIGSLISGSIPGSSEAMDAKRVTSTLRDFLMRLDQARDWICSITDLRMDITAFKEELPKGEILAKVVQAFDPCYVNRIHVSTEREYRHTDNIIVFLDWCKKIKLRRHFLFETVDLYESKNIPKVIYCIHGLAMFLNKRGIGRGIVVKDNIVFTYAEKSLFSEDISNISMQRYDDIHTRLDSEEENESFTGIRESNTSDAKPTVQSFVKCFSWRKAFKNLVSGESISVSALRKFIDFDFSSEKAKRIIGMQQQAILDMFKDNNKKEIEKDNIIHTIRLLHENINELRNIPASVYPLASDYKYVKKMLFRLIHDYRLCYQILATGYELPLRTLFPDNTIGDFHFSKLIISNIDEYESPANDELLLILAREHFISSRIFRKIVDAYRTTADFDLNPIRIHEYLMKKETLGALKTSLLDEAISEEAVRAEILKRSQAIIDFIISKFQFLCTVELPYYAKAFATHPAFFEYFIEPAILMSENNVVAELMSQIFSNSSECTQERVYKSGGEFLKTYDIDFSDYSPLKDFIEESRCIFPQTLTDLQSIATDVDDYFIQHASVGDILQVEINVEEINGVISVLKQKTDLMTHEMQNLVNSLAPVRSSESVYRVEVHSQFGNSKFSAPVKSGSVVLSTENSKAGFDPENSKASFNSENCREIEIPQKPNEFPRSSTEKFVLRLDNQFSSELDEDDSVAITTLLQDLKYRIMLLIAISSGKTLDAVLNETTENEVLAFNQANFSDSSLQSVKEAVINDMKLLVESGAVRSSNGHVEILRMIASDILSCKYRLLDTEINLNIETSDALFHKGALLDRYIAALYQYTNDLVQGMFVNKSGMIFNRQCEPYTKFGTYLLPLEDFRAQIYEGVSVDDMGLKISCESPMIFDLCVYLREKRVISPITVRFDSLLRMREEGLLYFDLAEVCCISVGSLIETINERYIKY